MMNEGELKKQIQQKLKEHEAEDRVKVRLVASKLRLSYDKKRHQASK